MNKLTMLICSGAILSGATALNAAQPQPLWPRDVEMAALPTYSGSDLELTVDANGTHWRLWSPEAEAARAAAAEAANAAAKADTDTSSNSGSSSSDSSASSTTTESPSASDTSSSSSSGTYLGRFKLTGYCSCSICTGQWSGGSTASGTTPTAGRTIAMGGVPFGTKLMINGQVYTVEDRGTAYGHVDIFCSSHSEALSFGVQYADVYQLS